MPSPVIIVDHDPAWRAHFERYQGELAEAGRELFARIEHIGSTSVPGLAAKPIIDVLIGVDDPALLDTSAEPRVTPGDGQDIEPAGPARHLALAKAIKALGYKYRGNNGIPGRLLFAHRVITPPCHVHVARLGGELWQGYLRLRDHLRAHPEDAHAYGDLKRALASKYRNQRQHYSNAKSDFIAECMRKAKR